MPETQTPPKYDLTLLIVEDEGNVRNVFTDILKRRFLEVYAAPDGRLGLYLFKAHRPDIIITDIRMPDMDGLTMLGEIRKIDQETPVIIMSAFNDTTHLLQAHDYKIVAYVTKPVQKDQLLSALDKAIEKAKFNKGQK